MSTRTGNGKTNALQHDLVVRVQERCTASPEAIFDLLADLQSHLTWAGERQKRKTRLVSIDAPDGPATVGTEFSTVGRDVMGEFRDSSVVTEAVRASLFEFVTEAVLHTKKKGAVEWTVVHRYELSPVEGGCRIDYTSTVARLSATPGPIRLLTMRGVSGLALRMASAAERRGIKNLIAMAEGSR